MADNIQWQNPEDVKDLLWRRYAYMNAIKSIKYASLMRFKYFVDTSSFDVLTSEKCWKLNNWRSNRLLAMWNKLLRLIWKVSTSNLSKTKLKTPLSLLNGFHSCALSVNMYICIYRLEYENELAKVEEQNVVDRVQTHLDREQRRIKEKSAEVRALIVRNFGRFWDFL